MTVEGTVADASVVSGRRRWLRPPELDEAVLPAP